MMSFSVLMPANAQPKDAPSAAQRFATVALADRGPAGPENLSAGEILAGIERLAVVGSVLYVAAHPDDENTHFLSWLVKTRGLEATYLSMTRGGGGQNLIGTEQAELLDVVRTGELMAARHRDGALQRFSRMRDFGYSKTPKETLALWGHDEALADVVHTVRHVRPDLIITRFLPHGVNHGHHTASAILAREAFDAAADPQVKTSPLPPWRADRLLHNVSHWRLKPEDDTSGWLTLDIGGYDARTGLDAGEVAADSRSQHKSQGFGAAPKVGPHIEYFDSVAGTPLRPSDDLFRDLDLTWARFEGTETLREAITQAVRDFNPRDPAQSLPQLAKIHGLLEALEMPYWRERKLAEVRRLMVACAGLWLTARADRPAVAPGESLPVRLMALNRSAAEVRVHRAHLEIGRAPWGETQKGAQMGGGGAQDQTWLADRALRRHEPAVQDVRITVPAQAVLTIPHWLRSPPLPTRFQIDAADPLRDAPDTPPELVVQMALEIAGAHFVQPVPVSYAYTDAVQGERHHAVEVLPPVTASLAQQSLLVVPGQGAKGRAVLHAPAVGEAVRLGQLRLKVPAPFKVEPERVDFRLDGATPELVVDFEVTAQTGTTQAEAALQLEIALDACCAAPEREVTQPAGPTRGVPQAKRVADPAAGPLDDAAKARLASLAGQPAWSEARIDYAHLPPRTVLQPAQLPVRAVQLARGTVQRIAYLPGSGDGVADVLRELGYTVDLVDEGTVLSGGLESYDALVVGIRAYNTRPQLMALQPQLMAWVAAGGRMLVQYNTNNHFNPLAGLIGPYPFEISRDRVTDERAKMQPVRADHPALRSPNVLGPQDDEGWVQERGLYFAQNWDARYRTLFAMADEDEPPSQGAVLIAEHGEGRFIYTGLAFFRQLPAGVPGAARLFANLLGYEKAP